jgi:hypothetical protein
MCDIPVPEKAVEAAWVTKKLLWCKTCGARFDAPPPPPMPPPKASADEDELAAWFARWHALNPHVYEAFKLMAIDIRKEGHKRYGAKTILERLRWESDVRFQGSSLDYRLNNNIKDRCSSRFARLLIAEDPTFAGFFELRSPSTEGTRRKLSEAHKGGGGDPGY